MAVLHCEHTSTSRLVLAIINIKLFIKFPIFRRVQVFKQKIKTNPRFLYYTLILSKKNIKVFQVKICLQKFPSPNNFKSELDRQQPKVH